MRFYEKKMSLHSHPPFFIVMCVLCRKLILEFNLTESAGSGGVSAPSSSGKGSKKGKKEAVNAGMRDFVAEYAKSGRATCRGCEDKIKKVGLFSYIYLPAQ